MGVQSLCDLLVTHPYFNFSQNIAQAVVPFLNNPRKNIREIAKNAIKTVFKEDKKEEITLKVSFQCTKILSEIRFVDTEDN